MKKLFILYLLLISTSAFANRGHPVNDQITAAGNILQIAIPASAMIYSMAIGDYQGSKQLSYAVGSTFATTEILKYSIAEERPYQDEGGKGTTFPSGHTSFAFSGAGFWQMRYGWEIGAPMYALAAFTGYSRHHARMHNWLDVGVGASIGIGFNLLFTSKYNAYVAPTDGGAMLRFSERF